MAETELRPHATEKQYSLFVGEAPADTDGTGEERVESFERDGSANLLVRRVRTRSGESVESCVPPCHADFLTGEDLVADYDASWLRADALPVDEERHGTLRVVDLFSGCGGMTAGAKEAARALNRRCEPLLAVDKDATSVDVYRRNFPNALPLVARLEEVFGLDPDREWRQDQLRLRDNLGEVDLLLGGPPCQGHSALNNHSRHEDPKNALFFTMARATELLRPKHVVVENVRDIVHDSDDVFKLTRNYLEGLGYSVDSGLLKAEEFGVPQRRHRMFLVASRKTSVSVERMVTPFRVRERTFDWGCADLDGTTGRAGFDSATQPAEQTQDRIDWLFEKGEHELATEMRPPCHRDGHTYPGVYGRMWHDRPAPTITTGFPYMGQGRFVHPRERRTITPHEAARLQFFPDRFSFGGLSRAAYKRLIGNAVPPKLTYVLTLQLLR